MTAKGEYVSAKNYYQQALEKSQQLQNLTEQSKTHFVLAKLFMRANPPLLNKEKEHVEKASALFERQGQLWNYYKCIAIQGDLYFRAGLYDKAIESYEAAGKYFAHSPKSVDCLSTQMKLVRARDLKGDYGKAEEDLNQLNTQICELSNNYLMTKLKLTTGDHYFYKNQPKVAKRIYQEGIVLAQNEELHLLMVHFLLRLSLTAEEQDSADTYKKQATELLKSIGGNLNLLQDWERFLKNKNPKVSIN